MKHFLILAVALILTACGGGGGSSAPAPVINQPAPITSTVSFDMTLTQSVGTSAIPQRHVKPADFISDGGFGFTPSQIRAAYNMPRLATATPAQLGAGQTIYIIASNDDSQLVAELALFNKEFSLPGCTTVAANSVSIGKAPVTGCTLTVVYADTNGNMTTTVPAYNSNWAGEISLDVEWSHATAPYARIVLIETPNSNTTTFANAVSLANKMGPGVVSMSFASAEVSTDTGYDVSFNTPGMTYVAAAGDNGEQVNWPASSSKVLAVGGTSLYYGPGLRLEYGWTGTGGGSSLYVSLPSYQKQLGGSHRQVSDVSFNADPDTGQVQVQLFPGNPNPLWEVVGGTSIAAPQWAGLIAIANAMRADVGFAALGDIHTQLYANEFDFNDITQGTNGNCGSCNAIHGYDQLTGLGSPIANQVLNTLVNAPVEPSNPDNLTITISDLFSTFTVNDSSSTSVHVVVTGVPTGMSFVPNGNVVSIATTGISCQCELGITVTDTNNVSSSVTMNLNLGQ